MKLSSTTTSKHFLIWRKQIYSRRRIKWHGNKNERKKNNRTVAWNKSASEPRLGWYSEITDTLAGDHQRQKHTRTIIGIRKKEELESDEVGKNQCKRKRKQLFWPCEPAYIPIRGTSLRKSECTHAPLHTTAFSSYNASRTK